MSAKDRAVEIFKQHIAFATTNGSLFRKTVMDQLRAETGCTVSASATHYNYAKQSQPAIPGLGRTSDAAGVRKMGSGRSQPGLVPDDECFTVLELTQYATCEVVGRCQSFLHQGDASEKFDEKIEAWPKSVWVMIRGLGPNSTDIYKLGEREIEIKRYSPAK